MGRNEGTPRPGAYGRNTAAPLLFQIFDLLPPESGALRTVQRGADRTAQSVAAGLKRFVPSTELVSFAATHNTQPRITFPPNGAQLDLARYGSATTPLSLEATGGTPPFRWVVNGQPVPPAAIGAPAVWLSDGPGLVRISVTDHHNRTATAEVWIK